MQIDITGHQMEITDALRLRIEKDLAHMKQHVKTNIQKTHVVLNTQKHQHHCNIHLTIDGKSINAEGASDSMYTAIDMAVKKAKRQLDTITGSRHAKHS